MMGVTDTSDKFMTSVLDTDDKTVDTNIVFIKFQNGCNLTIRALGKPE